MAILLFSSVPTLAEMIVDTAWVRRYDGYGNGNDESFAIAVDGSGNVYITGWSWGGTYHDEIVTIKYYPNGDTAWTRRYNGLITGGEGAHDLTIDGSGNVYVTGWSWSGETYLDDYVTIKYYPNGDTAWVRKYNGPGNGYDKAFAIAVDHFGNVYITGETWDIDAEKDYTTIKYYPNGDTAWVRKYGAWSYGNQARGIALDDLGNIYVTGSSWGSMGTEEYATVKYDSNGNELWVRRYGYDEGWANKVSDITLDTFGNVYVTGGSCVGDVYPDCFDYATIKYYPNGDTAWIRRYNGPGAEKDYASAIAVDGSCNVYVTGYSYDSTTYQDYTTIKYNPDGETVWVRRYNGTGNDYDYASAIALDGSGNVYVTGTSRGMGTYYDYATIKYDTDGNEIWVKRYDRPGSQSDEAHAITTDGCGNVYITGRCEKDYVTIKYSQAFNGDANGDGEIGPSDVVYLINYLFKEGPAPEPMWNGDANCDGVVDPADVVYLINYLFRNGPPPGCP